MKVLVTGAGGQLGSELVARFEQAGNHEVVATDRNTLDLASRDSIMSAITSAAPDVVLHSGAFTAVDNCESDWQTAMRVNALGTRHVVEAARIAGARVLYVSTDYVFDGTLDRPYNEWDTPNPQSVYGRSKLGGEHELHDGDTIVRTSWVFGRNGANMVKTVLKLMQSHSELKFVDDQHGKPTCAADLADAIYTLTVNRLPGTFHVTNEGATTWYQFVRDVLSAAGEDPDRVKPIPTSELNPPRPAPRPVNSVLENAALHLQGLPLLSDHRDALQRTVKELLSQ
jgi:dTDP-4-dehydrorhamnose reductase